MRAIVLDEAGQPTLGDVPEPSGDGELVRILACGLCGSDVEKLGRAPAGTVLGHEVSAELQDGRRAALVHHLPCGECQRCRQGHETTCERFDEATIVPGGFAERARAADWVGVPEEVDALLASFAEPLACVLRAAEQIPRGRLLVVGLGFVGNLFVQVLKRRGDDVFGVDRLPERRLLAGVAEPDGEVDAAVLCAAGGSNEAALRLAPGGPLVVFASGGLLDLDSVYRRELRVLGSRSATPRHMHQAVDLLPALDPIPTLVLPLERFDEGLARYSGREVLKVVFTP